MDSEEDKRVSEFVMNAIWREREFYAYAAARGVYRPIPPPWAGEPSLREWFNQEFVKAAEEQYDQALKAWEQLRKDFDGITG